MIREITCIGCPMGCGLTVTLEGDKIANVTGHSCKIGVAHAERDCTSPTRYVTTTVPVIYGDYTRVAVRTKDEVPKAKIQEVMKALQHMMLQAPVVRDAVVLENVAETGVDIIATQTIGARN